MKNNYDIYNLLFSFISLKTLFVIIEYMLVSILIIMKILGEQFMQKWEKFLILILLILALLGTLIGFTLTKFGIDKIKILADIDVFGLFEILLLIIVIFCAIFDIYETYECNNQFINSKVKVIAKSKTTFRNIFIFFIFLCILELGIFFYSFDIYILPLLFINLILTSMIFYHNSINDCINDDGLLYWGIYYNWNYINSYKLEEKTLLKINLINMFFIFEYNSEIQFNFDLEYRNDIEKLISENLRANTKTEIIPQNINIISDNNSPHKDNNDSI